MSKPLTFKHNIFKDTEEDDSEKNKDSNEFRNSKRARLDEPQKSVVHYNNIIIKNLMKRDRKF